VVSVAAFLDSAGFPRTLAALQSEAGLEVPSPCTLVVLPFWCAVAEAPDWGISVNFDLFKFMLQSTLSMHFLICFTCETAL